MQIPRLMVMFEGDAKKGTAFEITENDYKQPHPWLVNLKLPGVSLTFQGDSKKVSISLKKNDILYEGVLEDDNSILMRGCFGDNTKKTVRIELFF